MMFNNKKMLMLNMKIRIKDLNLGIRTERSSFGNFSVVTSSSIRSFIACTDLVRIQRFIRILDKLDFISYN